MEKAIRRRGTRHWGQFLLHAALILWAVTTIFPFVWVLLSSFKGTTEIMSKPFALPEVLSLFNYADALERFNIPRAYMNSLILSGSVTIVVTLLATMAAYGIARYKFRYKRGVNALLIASMMFPAFSVIIPVFRIIQKLGLIDNIFGVALPQMAGNMSFAIIIMAGYIRGMSNEVEEAAFIEGCNAFQILFRVVVPIVRPAMATVAIFTFVWSYNDLFTQLFFLRNPQSWAITRLLNEFTVSQGRPNYGLMAASVVMVVAPVLVIYILLQKNIIKGMTAGAVKG
ncbi:MAG: carbohydrate ABC transporter permease [Oscillospiraceae bacterium]|jgi:raffinose/stachyose/melibiose transport system permease protein|nr:carbohydrate ABC transporter permease [Oscillospiraceae bacterium]